MRQALLYCCYMDWSSISPAIFGSMFQSVMNPRERRNLGAHYSSEKNILKLIKPLFLNELWADFEKVKDNKNALRKLHEKMSRLRFLDPACGCGNFLIIAKGQAGQHIHLMVYKPHGYGCYLCGKVFVSDAVKFVYIQQYKAADICNGLALELHF